MSPLFLLFSLFGAGVFTMLGPRSDTDTTSTPATKTPQSSPTVGEEPVVAPAPEEPAPVEEPAPAPEEEPVAEDPVIEEPVAEEPVAEEPVLSSPDPVAPDQTGGSGTAGGETVPLAAEGSVSVYAGRVATFQAPGDDVSSVRILDGVDHGTVTVNPDNTMALVMTQSDFTGSQTFSYQATHADGSTSTHTVNLNVQPGLQGAGWGTGESHYMLATDADDRVVVEHGEVHTKVYVSGGTHALSLAEIAQMEGVSEGSINGAWLAENGYGQTESTALDPNAGMMLWNHVTPMGSQTSNWLLLERGHQYDINLTGRDISGESEIQPLHLGAWGEGMHPELTNHFYAIGESVTNFVIQDIHFSEGLTILDAENVIVDNSAFSDAQSVIQSSTGITIRNSDFSDIFLEASHDGGDWDPGDDRISALYVGTVDGLLIDGNFVDKAGWNDGYDFYGDGNFPQPPQMFSHGLYLNMDIQDLTVRDTIIMRASSFGLQARSGGFIEDNLLLDNNIGANFLGGDFYDAGLIGNYTLFADNVVTSAGYRDAEMIGGLDWGVDSKGQLSTLLDNIITHLADPNNSVEIANKPGGGMSYQPSENHYYDDTITYNWGPPDNTNLGDLDTSVLDQTTIQLFAAELLGVETATIEDLANFLRAQAADGMYNDAIDADAIIAYFQQGFGLYDAPRSTAETARFVPSDLGDGVRWDNRLNWTTDDLPGSVAGDSADLGGNHVVFGTNATIDTLALGDSGELDVYGGRLTLTGGITGEGTGVINIVGAGQLWTEGGDADGLAVDIESGRFANTGQMSGADLTATGGQAILATGGAEYGVAAGDTLSVDGGADAGFDGDDGGLAILSFHDDATLELTSGDGTLGSIGEFRSGAFGETPDIASGIDLGGAALSIDLSGVSGTDLLTLLEADEIVGAFDTSSISGLSGRDAEVIVDYEADTVRLQLSAGSGNVTVSSIGVESDVSDGDLDIWNALTDGQGVFTEDASLEEEELIVEAA